MFSEMRSLLRFMPGDVAALPGLWAAVIGPDADWG